VLSIRPATASTSRSPTRAQMEPWSRARTLTSSPIWTGPLDLGGLGVHFWCAGREGRDRMLRLCRRTRRERLHSGGCESAPPWTRGSIQHPSGCGGRFDHVRPPVAAARCLASHARPSPGLRRHLRNDKLVAAPQSSQRRRWNWCPTRVCGRSKLLNVFRRRTGPSGTPSHHYRVESGG
jgi:hypothetical protein